MVVIDRWTETVVKVGEPYASYQVALLVHQCDSVSGVIIYRLEDNNDQKNRISNISAAKNNLRQVFARKEFEINKGTKNGLEVIEDNAEKI